MSDPSTIFYQMGEAVAAKVSLGKQQLLTGNNTWTGSYNDFNGNVSIGGTLSVAGSTTLDSLSVLRASTLDSLTVSNDVTVNGDLTVNGTTTTISTSNTTIEDNFLILNKGAKDSSAEAPDAGLLFERANGTDNAALLFEESSDRFEVGLTTGDGAGVSLGNVSLGGMAVNKLFIGTRASTQSLGDLADFNAGLTA